MWLKVKEYRVVYTFEEKKNTWWPANKKKLSQKLLVIMWMSYFIKTNWNKNKTRVGEPGLYGR